MGVGNLTELTDADTTGITMTLMGMVSELRDPQHPGGPGEPALPHGRSKEAELARRILHAARKADGSLPQGYDPGPAGAARPAPVPQQPGRDRGEGGRRSADANFRIEVAEDGIHVYNRDGHHVARDPFDLFPQLGVEQDGRHAFYLGVELARAQVAHQLGKRYVQDNELRWGVAVPPADRGQGCTSSTAGSTLEAPQDRRKGA